MNSEEALAMIEAATPTELNAYIEACRIELHPMVRELGIPEMSEEEYQGLLESMQRQGWDPAQKVSFLDGKLVDGRHRIKAAIELQLNWQEHIEHLPKKTDPLDRIYFAACTGRQLSKEQRGHIAQRYANLRRGGDRRSEAFKGEISPLKNTSLSKAADEMGVSPDMAKQMRAVDSSGDRELLDACLKGEIAAYKGAKIAKLPAEERKQAIAEERGNKGKKRKTKDEQERDSEKVPSILKAAYKKKNDELAAEAKKNLGMKEFLEVVEHNMHTWRMMLDDAKGERYARQEAEQG